MIRASLASAALLSLLLWAPASAHHVEKGTRHGDLLIEHVWARATPGQAKVGAAYAEVANTGGAVDRLIAASVEEGVAQRVELHTHAMDGGVMRMRKIDAVEIDPGAEVVMRPGGVHIMLIGLKAPLRHGARFPMTLTFEKAGPVTVDVEVWPVGAAGPQDGASHVPPRTN